MKGSHKMVTKSISVAIKGGKMKKGKKQRGLGGGERHCGDEKVFSCHATMVTKNLSVAM
jgi:hypothetical protein